MNLFVTDPNPLSCAIVLDDRRLIKAVLETTQLISTVVGCGYRPTHPNHPVTLWVGQGIRTSQALPYLPNLAWTFAHLHALNREYCYRFGKTHKSMEHWPTLLRAAKNLGMEMGRAAQPAKFQNSARNAAQGLDFTHLPVPQSYREYLSAKWDRFDKNPKWTKAKPPEWAPLRFRLVSDETNSPIS